jgi:hypothetical protein
MRRKKNPKRKHKEHIPGTPVSIAAYKKLFIAQLALGRSPGVAADNIKINRSTAYAWKKEDAEFDAAWIDAVETALDKLETRVYNSGMRGNASNAQFTLKHRRKSVYGNVEGDRGLSSETNYFMNITLEERLERLKRLGLPLPVIESDHEEDYAPDDANHS